MPIDRNAPCVNRAGRQLTIEQAERALDEAAAIIIGISVYDECSDLIPSANDWAAQYSPEEELKSQIQIATKHKKQSDAITGPR